MRCYITVPNHPSSSNSTSGSKPQPLALSCNRQKELSITSPGTSSNSTNGASGGTGKGGTSSTNGASSSSSSIFASEQKNTMTVNEEWYLIPDDDENPGIVKVINRAHNVALECPPVGKLSARALPFVDRENSNSGSDSDESFLWILERQDEDDNDEENSNGTVCTASLSPASRCSVRLRSMATNFYLSYTITNHGSFVTCCAARAAIQSTQKQAPTTLWKLEYCTGELCYIHHQPPKSQAASTFMDTVKAKITNSSAPPSRRVSQKLMCDNLGRVRMTNKFGGWEVWRFLHAGNGQVRISSWTHQDYFLMCDIKGRVLITEDRWSDATLWKVERASLEGLSIQSTKYKRYLTRQDGNGSLSALTMFVRSMALWQFTAAHQQNYYLSSPAQDKRLSLLKNNAIATSRHRRDCEIWELVALEHGFVMLRSQKWGTFLKCDNQKLGVSKDPQDEVVLQSCIWKIIPSPISSRLENRGGDCGGGSCIVSAMEHGLALSCHTETGELRLVQQNETISECWNLEPCMPDSLQQWQINLMVGGVIGAAVLPVVAMGAASAIAGSAAAGAGSAAAGGEYISSNDGDKVSSVAFLCCIANLYSTFLPVCCIAAAGAGGAAAGTAAAGGTCIGSNHGAVLFSTLSWKVLFVEPQMMYAATVLNSP